VERPPNAASMPDSTPHYSLPNPYDYRKLVQYDAEHGLWMKKALA